MARISNIADYVQVKQGNGQGSIKKQRVVWRRDNGAMVAGVYSGTR